jgi:hypothetical protein
MLQQRIKRLANYTGMSLVSKTTDEIMFQHRRISMIGNKEKFKGMPLSLVLAPYFAGIGIIMLGVIPMMLGGFHRNHLSLGVGAIIMVLGGALFILGIIFQLIMLYRIWYIIQDGNVRTTPGKAVGFLFIPFFNFYWIFVAYYGLAVDFNRYIQEREYNIAPLTPGIFMSNAVLSLCEMIPTLGSLAALANLVISIIKWVQTASRLNALVAIKNKDM